MTIGEKIKSLRKEKGYTQEELAEYAGTKKQTIHKYETGIIENIPASKVKLIAEKLDTTPCYLMGWEDECQSEQGISESFENNYSAHEISILDKYKRLNNKGKPKAETYIDDLLVNPQYTVPDDANSVPEEHIELKLVAENKNSVPPIVDDITHT